MALVACIVQTTMELINRLCECFREGSRDASINMIQIPSWTVKATTDAKYWKGTVEEMFSDDVYTSSRLRVVQAYTDAVCIHLDKHYRSDKSLAIRRTQVNG
jgi:hypothetical protein